MDRPLQVLSGEGDGAVRYKDGRTAGLFSRTDVSSETSPVAEVFSTALEVYSQLAQRNSNAADAKDSKRLKSSVGDMRMMIQGCDMASRRFDSVLRDSE